MEKQTQDKSSTDNKSVTGQDPDRYEQGYGSFTENDYKETDKEENTSSETPGSAATGNSDKANIETGMNEDKSTISNTSAPSGDKTGEATDSNSTSS